MSKKIIIINVIGMVLIAGIFLYFFNLKNKNFSQTEKNTERPIGFSYEPVFKSEVKIYPGAIFLMDYRNKSLLARHYIVREKQEEIINFYKEELKEFDVTQDIYTSNARHFIMSNRQMESLFEEGVDDYVYENQVIEAHESFYRKNGTLMMIEIGRQPQPFWNYSYFNHDRDGAPEETMIVFWFYYPDIN